MEFFDVLVRYEVSLWSTVEDALAHEVQVGLGRLHALRVIDRYDGRARVQDLSSEIGITVGAASKLVDRLERDRLAVRRHNPANRRSSLITLTPEGERSLSSAAAVQRRVIAAAIGDEDVDGVVAALRRLQDRLDAGSAVAA